MRPLNLRISAFGPYADEMIIPMNQLGEKGLYLITGDTGAGKTTIFDAICFALYGTASGANRDAGMLRSKYAEPGTPTEVELLFEHAGNEYRIRRNPEYMRPAKRGAGETKEAARVELVMPDGQVISKTGEVSTAIEELLGVNRDQFSQIAMLAQGDFLKLLLAKTEDRQVGFRKLFKTGLYQELQNKLSSEASSLDKECKAKRASVEQYIDGMLVAEDNVLSIDVEKAKSGLLNVSETIELLQKLIEEDNSLLTENDNSLEGVNSALANLDAIIGAAEETDKIRKALVEANAILESELEKLALIQAKKTDIEKAYAGRDGLLAKLKKLEGDIEQVGKYKSILKEAHNIKSSIEKSTSALESKKEEQTNIGKNIEALKSELEGLKEAGVNREKLQGRINEVKQLLERVDDLKKSLTAYDSTNRRVCAAENEYAEADRIFKKLLHTYVGLDQAFRDGQAGVLAESLKDGDKCPVCGSTSHPQLAHKLESVPTKEKLDAARIQAEEARENANKVSGFLGEIRGRSATEGKNLSETMSKLLGTSDIEKGRAGLDKKFSDLTNELNELTESMEAENRKVSRKASLEKTIPEHESRLAELGRTISEDMKSLSSLEAILAEKKLQANDIKRSLENEDENALLKAKNDVSSEISRLDNMNSSVNREFNNQNGAVAEIKGKISGYTKSLEDAEKIDLAEIKDERARLGNQQRELNIANQTIRSRYDRNVSILNNINAKSSDLETAEKKLKWLMTLSNTANGKLTGKDRIMLETYIQATYFDRIISRANLRLMTMSSAQYELKRCEEGGKGASKTGLDLNVIDHYNGSERSVKSLSGGESFMAALSLALGLSDEVQASAGGIRIDTMFVDEGFGSLDPDTLELAYSALAGLTEGNRLVGIISHVGDLKEKIDKQIVVTKKKSGGSFVEMVV